MVEQFFRDLFGDEKIYFRCLGGKIPESIQGKWPEVKSRLKNLNENGRDIYFVVNSGGYKDIDIKRINACFIDLDAGKDADGNNLPLEKVNKFKKEKIRQLHNFSLKPSYSVETRNGLHVYWLLREKFNTIHDWKNIEEKLINYFGADEKVKNLARLMRCPGFYWMKNPEEKFMCNIIERNDVRYSLDEIKSTFKDIKTKCTKQNPETLENTGLKGDPKRGNDNNKKTLLSFPTKYNSILCSNDRIKMIMTMDIFDLKKIISAEPVTFYNDIDIRNYLKQQDLALLLGVNGKSFNCLFHDDEHPSAGIIQNEETGHYIYHCFGCNWKGTIFQVVERLTGLNKPKTLEFLMEIYNIRLEQTEWQKEQIKILEDNMKFMMSDEFEQMYPDLYARVKRYLPQLYTINGIARDFVITENFCDDEGNPLFYSSIINLTKMCKKTSVDKMCCRIALFTWLELMKKLSDEQIPKSLLSISKKYQKINKRNERISFFSIPSYVDNVLRRAEQKAQEWKSRGMTMKGLSREMILRVGGNREADRVYPQMAGKPISKRNEQKSMTIEKVCCELIEKKGFTTEKEIIRKIRRNKKKTEEQLKKMLPEMLDKYGLKREWANKELKNKFKLPDDFRGIIIYKDI